MPIPVEPWTALCSTIPIDISVTEIPRRRVWRTRLPISIVCTECVTIPSPPPTTVQPLTSLISMSYANEMSIPCAYGFVPQSTRQLRIETLLWRPWLPPTRPPHTPPPPTPTPSPLPPPTPPP